MKPMSFLLVFLAGPGLFGCSTIHRAGPQNVLVAKVPSPDRLSGAGVAERFSGESTAGWEEKYATFSAALIQKAASKGLDSAALSRVLRTIPSDPKGHRNCPMLPVEAYATTQDAKPVWIVILRWTPDEETFGHICEYSYIVEPSGLRLLDFKTCK